MINPETGWTDEQRTEAAQRTLSDAELLKRGATYAASGRLELGKYQLEYFTLTENNGFWDPVFAEFADMDPPPPRPEDAWLGLHVSEALEARYGERRAIPQPLRHMNITIRSLLLRGRARRMEGIGAKSKEILGALVAENEFGIVWKDHPTPQDMAVVCQRLGQIPAWAIGIHSNKSVLRVLRMPYEQRLETASSRLGRYTPPEELDRAFYWPEIFAHQFTEERNRLEPPAWEREFRELTDIGEEE